MAGDNLRHRRLSLARGCGAHWPGTELAVRLRGPDLSQEEPADGWRQPPAPEVVAGRPVARARTCLKRSRSLKGSGLAHNGGSEIQGS